MWPQMDLCYYFMQCMFNLSSCFNKRLTGGPQVSCTPFYVPLAPPAIQKHSHYCNADVTAWGAADVQQTKKRWYQSKTLKQTSHNWYGIFSDAQNSPVCGIWERPWPWKMSSQLTVQAWRASGPSGDCSVGKRGRPYTQGDIQQGVAIIGLQEDVSGKGKRCKGKRRPWPSATVTLRNEGWTWEDPSHHSPHQGGLSEGLMLPPAQLQAHWAQRQ